MAGEETTHRFPRHRRLGGEHVEQQVETLGRRMGGVDENLPPAPDGARAPWRVSERFFADDESDVACQLHRLLEEAQRVGHGRDA